MAFVKEHLIYSEGLPKERYRHCVSLIGKANGQLNILFDKLFFLNHMYVPSIHRNPVIVYVGSGHSIGTSVIHELFPEFRFILYDTIRPTVDSFRESGRVTWHNEYFDPKNPPRIEGDIFFICDVRKLSHDGKKMSPLEMDQGISEDMELQAEILRVLKPVASLLKFRAPHDNEDVIKHRGGTTFEYFSGIPFIQPWAGVQSIEMRLIVASDEPSTYDFRNICDVLFYHNTRVRSQEFIVDRATSQHLASKAKDHDDSKYDIAGSIFIISEYLLKVGLDPTPENIHKIISMIP